MLEARKKERVTELELRSVSFPPKEVDALLDIRNALHDNSIAVIGVHDSGKTTLLNSLKLTQDTLLIPEVARTILEIDGELPITSETQARILHKQLELEIDALTHRPKLLLCDRCGFDIHCYSLFFNLKEPPQALQMSC